MQNVLTVENKTKNDMIILTCGSGMRSAKAADSLTRAGYKNVWHIPDGYAGDDKVGINSQNAWKLAVRDLAQLTGMNKATIVRLEAGKSVRESSIDSIRDVLEAKGVRFWKSKTLNRVVISVDDRSDLNGL